LNQARRGVRSAAVHSWKMFAIGLWALSAAMACGEPPTDAKTRIAGVATIGPINAGPLARASFTIKAGEQVVASFATDEQGRFSVSLPPGRYIAELNDRMTGTGQCGPFSFEVAAGKMKTVEWHCDNSTAARLPKQDR
jgi:hypothetical protein